MTTNCSKIESKDISVVVQGAINEKLTPLCLESIRKCLPDAEIILSTWEGSDVNGLDYDKVILNKDPGKDFFKNVTVNTKRQIYSTRQGLLNVSRCYAIKIRSDLTIESNSFLNYFNQFDKFNENYRVFDKRIIISSYYTRLPTESCFLYHPSDWFAFGLTKDLINLYDISLPDKENDLYTEYFELVNPGKQLCTAKYWGEQYIFVKCLLKNNKNIFFKDHTDINTVSRHQSLMYLLNNFIILDYNKELKIRFNKYNLSDEFIVNQYKIYTFSEWLNDYKCYCDSMFYIPLKYAWQYQLQIENDIKHIEKHFKNLIRPVIIFFKWSDNILSVFYYVFKTLYKSVINISKLIESIISNIKLRRNKK